MFKWLRKVIVNLFHWWKYPSVVIPNDGKCYTLSKPEYHKVVVFGGRCSIASNVKIWKLEIWKGSEVTMASSSQIETTNYRQLVEYPF
jgi:hypothetical protein